MDSTKILLVDDNPDIRKGLGLRLRANEYEVLFAVNAVSATAAAVAFFQKPVEDSKLLSSIDKALHFPRGVLLVDN